MLQTKKRDVSIDLLRGFAAVCVILGHSFIVYPVNLMEVPCCKIVHDMIYSFHMELFFVLAGWVWHCKGYKKYILGKTTRIMIPYLIFSIASLLLHMVGGDLVNSGASLKDGVINILLYGGDYWFLYSMFIIYAAYPLIEKVINKTWKKAVLITALLLLSSLLKLPNVFTLSAIIEYLPFFVFGTVLEKALTDGGKEFSYKHWWKIALIMAGAYAGLHYVIVAFELEEYSVLTFIRAVAMCTVLYVLANRSVSVLKKFGGGGYCTDPACRLQPILASTVPV